MKTSVAETAALARAHDQLHTRLKLRIIARIKRAYVQQLSNATAGPSNRQFGTQRAPKLPSLAMIHPLGSITPEFERIRKWSRGQEDNKNARTA